MRQRSQVSQFQTRRATYGPTVIGPSRQSAYRMMAQMMAWPAVRTSHAANSRQVGVYRLSGVHATPAFSAALRYGSLIRPNGGVGGAGGQGSATLRLGPAFGRVSLPETPGIGERAIAVRTGSRGSRPGAEPVPRREQGDAKDAPGDHERRHHPGGYPPFGA